nr:immunoglobulin light chain junction region [Macaca mulatta]MOY10043.1 immunoglobulin light chain junction region [Macaca mulatta]
DYYCIIWLNNAWVF